MLALEMWDAHRLIRDLLALIGAGVLVTIGAAAAAWLLAKLVR